MKLKLHGQIFTHTPLVALLHPSWCSQVHDEQWTTTAHKHRKMHLTQVHISGNSNPNFGNHRTRLATWCTGAVARSFLLRCFCLLLFLYWFVALYHAAYLYSFQDLWNIGLRYSIAITSDFQPTHNISKDIWLLGSPWITYTPDWWWQQQRETKQKQGCQAGLLVKLKKQPTRPPLPRIFLTSSGSITHKMSELDLQVAANSLVQNCCGMIITENSLHPQILNAAVQLTGHTTHRFVRNRDSGKSRRGGLCIPVNNDYSNSWITDSYRSPDLEVMSLTCRPFYLPRELTVVIIMAVYIPPDANVSSALFYPSSTINKQECAHPDSVFIIAGVFNQAICELLDCGEKYMQPCLFQHKACIQSHTLASQTTSPCLSKPTTKTIKTWPEGALSQLQDFLNNRTWRCT